MSPFVLPTKFTAIDAMSPTVRAMAGNITSMTDKMNVGIARQERLFRRLTPSLGGVTKQLLSYAGAGSLIAGLGYSGKAVMDYETAIQSLQAVTGVSNTELATMKAEVESLAVSTKKSATDIAGSFEVVGSMMSQYLSDPTALRQITDAGITLAKAGRTELVPTLENLTSIMNQFDIQANKATDTINRLTAGEVVGSLRTSQVAEALQEFGAGAYSANVSLSESVALVEALAKQMKVDKIGVGARNILTVLDSAKGLDKRARKDLRAAGVDLNFLMDRSKSLSERLHELAKVSGDSTKITSIFGKENKTAAQVIFNQLGTFDEYLAKIKVTNAAQTQAATNSKTFRFAVDELKNSWINYITTSDKAASGLAMLSRGAQFLAHNIDNIVTYGLNAVKLFVLWKGAILAAKVATVGYSVALGIQNVAMGLSIGLLEGNILAQNVAMVSKRALGVATQMLAGNFTALNAAMAANPVGLIITGVVALTAAIYLLDKRNKELRAEYEKKIQVDITTSINSETEAVKKLVAQYWNLGMGIKDATAAAIKFRLSSIDYQRTQVESRISQTKAEIAKEDNKLYFSDLFKGAMGMDLTSSGRRGELREQLVAQQASATKLASSRVAELQFAQSQVASGTVSAKDLGFFKGSSTQTDDTKSMWGNAGKGADPNFRFYEQIVEAIKANPQKVMVEFKNAPAGTSVSTTGAGVSTASSY
jgi:TP901 family phage tail tape measure protein